MCYHFCALALSSSIPSVDWNHSQPSVDCVRRSLWSLVCGLRWSSFIHSPVCGLWWSLFPSNARLWTVARPSVDCGESPICGLWWQLLYSIRVSLDWCADSFRFSGGDSEVSALSQNWWKTPLFYHETHWQIHKYRTLRSFTAKRFDRFTHSRSASSSRFFGLRVLFLLRPTLHRPIQHITYAHMFILKILSIVMRPYAVIHVSCSRMLCICMC